MDRRIRLRCGHGTLPALLLALGACQPPVPDTSGVVLDGLAIGSQPLRDVTIEVWPLDERGIPSMLPSHTVQSDSQGRFRIEGGKRLLPPFLVTARGGVTTEYWSAEDLALADRVHIQAVVTHDWLAHEPRAEMPLVLSPLTTVAAALAERRAALDAARDFDAAATAAHALLDTHFEIDLRRTRPARAPDALPTEQVRYALALAGLSGLVHEAARRTERPIHSMNIAMLTAALVEDARGPGARLDGEGPIGPVALGTCGAQCLLPADALRGALVRALVGDFLVSAANETGLGFGDVSEYLLRLSGRALPALFGEGAPEELDTRPPTLDALPSPVYDESRDRIAFDEARAPRHVHDTLATIDLARGFGDTCPVVYKHADLLGSSDSNPLRWSVAVRDDLVGVSPLGVSASIRPMNGAAPALELVASPGAAIQGGFTFDVSATGAELAALVSSDGTYEVELRARDWLGNEAAPLVGCWQHVTLAAPLWAGGFDVAMGPGSLDETRLENDNLAPVLRGEQAPVLARLLVENNTDEDVYLTLGIDALVGRYTATWTRSRALLYSESGLNDCLDTGACTTALPPEPVSQILPPQAIPASLAAVRVIDRSTGLEAACPGCRPGEVRIAGRGRYEVQVVAADLGFLVAADVDRARIAEIRVGPIGNAARLTGVDGGVYVHCMGRDGDGACILRIGYQLYQALTDAVIQIDSLVVSAMVSPSPALAPRRPQPPADAGASTLSAPVSTTLTWTTLDESLPDPG